MDPLLLLLLHSNRVCSFNCFPSQFINFTCQKRAQLGKRAFSPAPWGKLPQAPGSWLRRGCSTTLQKHRSWKCPEGISYLTHKGSQPPEPPQATHPACPYHNYLPASSEHISTTSYQLFHHLWVHNFRNHLTFDSEDVSACKSQLVEAFPTSGSKDQEFHAELELLVHQVSWILLYL